MCPNTNLEQKIRSPSSSESGLNGVPPGGLGLQVSRIYTQSGTPPLDHVVCETRTVQILGRDAGDTKFQMDHVQVPPTWSQLATDILAEKYFRKRGVPNERGTEYCATQVVQRISHSLRGFGEQHGYFTTPEDAQAFEDELSYLLIHQYAAFNSPVWFNCGLSQAYGITGDRATNWVWNMDAQQIEKAPDAYTYPQCSACFIQAVDDNMESIYDLVKKETMLFKYGSGTGTNFSKIRGEGEPLSGGGTSSGLMSFLKVLDAGAGATKSGGTTRRAAKMDVLNIDHPDIVEFIRWKQNEEKKVAALIAAGYPSDFEGEAYRTVSGQNSNNSVRMPDAFLEAVLKGGVWQTTARTTGKVWKDYQAKDLWRFICEAAWASADPGLQFDTTINAWHTCKNTGRINASNPCSEYMFLDDSACNLASLNLVKFMDDDDNIDVTRFRHACEILITAQEIIVDYASYPSQGIAQNSHDYRPLGLGYANLGALLMRKGIPYDSPEARVLCGAITAIMTGRAYGQSAKIAEQLGPFAGYNTNREPFLGVMQMHRDAVDSIRAKEGETSGGLEALIDAAREDWDRALALGQKHGFRNAQTTVLAPTGTIALLMDCDTTGIEPDFGLVKLKKLAGGGFQRIVNQSIVPALLKLGYSRDQAKAVKDYVLEEETIEGAPHLKAEHYAIFDCASKAGKGTRFIDPRGHVRMVAAAQPFVSGAISKTINMPEETTVEDISAIYLEAWKRGVKAVALYRDNCKLSQPLNVKGQAKKDALPWGGRKTLPTVREGITLKARIGDQGILIRTGEYEDGQVGEVFVDMAKVGSALRGQIQQWAIDASHNFQRGESLEEFVEQHLFVEVDPKGFVHADGYPYIKSCTSVQDLVARFLAIEYLGRTDVAHTPPDQKKLRYNVLKARHGLTVDVPEQKEETKASSKKDVAGDAPCHRCGSFKMIRNGTCMVCMNCGTQSGCS